MNDLQSTVDRLQMKRSQQLEKIKNSETPEEQEVNRCFYHLAARLRPYPAVAAAATITTSQ